MGYQIGEMGYQIGEIGYQIGDGIPGRGMAYQIEGDGLPDRRGGIPDRGDEIPDTDPLPPPHPISPLPSPHLAHAPPAQMFVLMFNFTSHAALHANNIFCLVWKKIPKKS